MIIRCITYFYRFLKARLILLALILFSSLIQAQDTAQIKGFRLMFYNVENYFDSFDDSLTLDNEFLPHGLRNWDYKRFVQKRNNIYKTIMAVGTWEPPAIIGLCEIENRFVLNQLVYETPFAQFDYRIIHEESPDRRGIDVALLFNPKIFEVLDHKAIHIVFPFAKESTTRDILYVKGIVHRDTLHIFVNHWPSRYGGELSSEPRRIYVAEQLSNFIDQILAQNENAAILVMGDFNDFPYNKSIQEVLLSKKNAEIPPLVNLMPQPNTKLGTHKYQGDWGILDQIMVSRVLLVQDKSIFVAGETQIFDADFLLQDDAKFLGKMPFRTFSGMKYLGGFSDHLPIYIDFHLK